MIKDHITAITVAKWSRGQKIFTRKSTFLSRVLFLCISLRLDNVSSSLVKHLVHTTDLKQRDPNDDGEIALLAKQ